MADITTLIDVARGEQPADLLLENCRVVNTFSGEIKKENLAISQGRILGFGEYNAKKKIDLREQLIAPAFIDGHVHIESSMLSPEQFAAAIIKTGTTTIIADPHEIVNVLGLSGLELFLKRSKGLPVDIHFMMPSCVPATHLETSAHHISATDMKNWKYREEILGLGEMMNYPGVIFKDPGVLNKIRLFDHKIIDGHSPMLSGKELSAYLAAGISTDHECSTPAEALEKLEKGVFILIREGSAAKNLEALVPIVNQYNSRFFGFCTDDRHPDFLVEHGHINQMVKKAITLGVDPVTALQMASVNTARYYGLKNTGTLSIGSRADLVVFDSFERLNITKVFKAGELVVKDGELLREPKIIKDSSENSVNIPVLPVDFFTVKNQNFPVKVMELVPNQIITRQLIHHFQTEAKELKAQPEQDILKVAVIERHHGSGNGMTGFVRGFGLKTGAIASTVAHDSHNLIILGTNDDDMLKAVDVIRQIKGGLVVVSDGKLVASLPLPLAGIMSEQSLCEVKEQYDILLEETAKLGCKIADPFMMLSFLALPVIGDLKITDQGLVDVKKFDFVSLYGED